MSLADELERLADLHRSGALDDEEFEVAKAEVLAGGSRREPAPHDGGASHHSLGRAANRYVSFNIVWAVLCLLVMIGIFVFFILPSFKKHEERFDREWDRGIPVAPPHPGR